MKNNKLYKVAEMLMKLNKSLYSIEKVLLVIMSYSLVAVLFINVIFRFVLFIPSPWAEELGRYMFTWLVFLGSAAAMYNWDHIDINLIDTIVKKISKGDVEKFEKIMTIIKKSAVVFSISYLVYLFTVYAEYLQRVSELNLRSISLDISLLIPMSAVYFCSIIMIFHGVCFLIIPKDIYEREV